MSDRPSEAPVGLLAVGTLLLAVAVGCIATVVLAERERGWGWWPPLVFVFPLVLIGGTLLVFGWRRYRVWRRND
ncbi:MAG: hypothetical protein ACOY4R_01630 [Pseudomonadota bacterium]